MTAPTGATAKPPHLPGELERWEHAGVTVALGGHPERGPWVKVWSGPGTLPAELTDPADVTVLAGMVRYATRWLTPAVEDNQLSLLEVH